MDVRACRPSPVNEVAMRRFGVCVWAVSASIIAGGPAAVDAAGGQQGYLPVFSIQRSAF